MVISSFRCGGSLFAPSSENTLQCFLYSVGISSSRSFSFCWFAAAVHRWAKLAFLRKQRSRSVFQTCWQCFNSKEGVISTREAWSRFPFSQLMVGLKKRRKGYPRTIRSCPKFVIKKSISCLFFPSWTLSRHFLVMRPAWLFVPSMLWILRGFFRSSVGNLSLETTLGSRKFSVAPLSMRASSVFRVVFKTSLMVRAFCLVINIRRVDNARAATTSADVSENTFSLIMASRRSSLSSAILANGSVVVFFHSGQSFFR